MTTQSRVKAFFGSQLFLNNLFKKVSNVIQSTNKFNLVNIVLLAGFVAPLIYVATSTSTSNNPLATCNPYIVPDTATNTANSPATSTCNSSDILNQTEIQKGIDVSHYQGAVQWEKVATNNLSFAIAKATGGDSYTDPDFTRNWYEIRRNELIRGAYHFFYAGDDPKKQAQHFLNTVGKFRANDLPPILDIEITDQVSSELLKQRALTWLQYVEDKTDRKPIIYTDSTFARQFLNDARFGQYYLWLADYSQDNPKAPGAWNNKQWFLLQFTQSGKIEGVTGDVDLNQYRGSIDNLKTFIQLSNL